jgi:hypothetical protein
MVVTLTQKEEKAVSMRARKVAIAIKTFDAIKPWASFAVSKPSFILKMAGNGWLKHRGGKISPKSRLQLNSKNAIRLPQSATI